MVNDYANLLEEIKKATNLELSYIDNLHHTTKTPYILYRITPLSDDGIKSMDKFEVRIVAKNLLEAIKIDSQIRKLMLKQGDLVGSPFLAVEINGGGNLKEPNSSNVIQITYYKILKKSEAM